MNAKWFISLFYLTVFAFGSLLARADDLPENVTFETLVTFPLVIEGLTGDENGNLIRLKGAANRV